MNLATQERTELLHLHLALIQMDSDERLAILTKILITNPSIISLAVVGEHNPLGLTAEQKQWLAANRDRYGRNYANYVESLKAYRIEFGAGLKEAKDAIDLLRNA